LAEWNGVDKRRIGKILKTYRWYSILEAWRGGDVSTKGGDGMVAFTSRPRFLLPFAPEDMQLWTDEHYQIYDAVQLAIGQRKELTEKEIADLEKEARVDAIAEGKSSENILDIMKEMFNTDEDDYSMFVEKEEVLGTLEDQIRQQHEEYAQMFGG
jgi:hypothetical protein